MFGDLDKYLLVFLTGLVVTYLLTPVVRAAAIRFGVVDLPNERRPHKRPTARGGGLAVVLGV
ncbi:MAG TPA: undecaprenyl/decaprenyl-phosphate alpha-N-acetylglucosaminyl 1-phosphate transferase, partial [Candidatus Binatia bacterium]|nr:undecaprenyl/decaprenyl-phosphate alpha-N-acetylglucosaminyl 1-phosphate transferase [Candidatus Binatia bacterium]